MWQIILFAFAISLAVCLIIGPVLIPALRRLKFGQSIRSDGPERHLQKQGTPTMGGVMFFFSLILGTVFLAGDSYMTYFLLVCALGFGLIGFVDDYIKIVKKRSLGLTAKQKIIGQLALSVGVSVAAVYMLQVSTEVVVPLLGWTLEFGVLYIPFLIFLLVGTTNAVNLTDGLDGLASGVTLIVALGYMLIGVLQSQMAVVVFSAALAGSCLGFLVFNHHPAKVFMGDTGSLFLGGAVCGTAFALDMPLVLIMVGIIYIIETLSVIIQVGYFKLTHGKRFFKMAPIHHHFEKCGWAEERIDLTFAAITAVMCILAWFGVSGRF